MTQNGTRHILDYVNDYERAMQDYQAMGPLWAEMVFGDDFEALKALYGRKTIEMKAAEPRKLEAATLFGHLSA